MSKKVCVVGLDGATFTTLKSWMGEGVLPTLSAMAGEGVSGTLTSVIPPVSPVAWPTFMTGNNPGRHGIFGFQQKRKGEVEPYIPLGKNVMGPTIWDILTERGWKSIVLNVQMTYPPTEVDGVLVSGVMSPEISAYPKEYESWLKDQEYIIEGKGYVDTPKDEFIKSLYETTDKRFDAAEKLMDKIDYNFLMMLVSGTDRAQHYMWDDMCEKHPKYGNVLRDYYTHVDGLLGKLFEKAGDDATKIVLSDHGFSQQKKRVHINHWLEKRGYVTVKDNWGNRRKKMLLHLSAFLKSTGLSKLIVKVMVRGGRKPGKMQPPKIELDYEKSRAFTCGYYTGQIYLNPSLPEEEYETVREKLINEIKDLSDPDTGKKIVEGAWRREEIYAGSHLDDAPDILVHLTDGYWVVGGFNYPRLFEGVTRETGQHSMDGVLFMSGQGVRKGAELGGAKLIDVAPTILSLYNIKADMDGRVLSEVLEPKQPK